MICWLLKKMLGVPDPPYYAGWGCLGNNELDDELKRLKEEGAWS